MRRLRVVRVGYGGPQAVWGAAGARRTARGPNFAAKPQRAAFGRHGSLASPVFAGRAAQGIVSLLEGLDWAEGVPWVQELLQKAEQSQVAKCVYTLAKNQQSSRVQSSVQTRRLKPPFGWLAELCGVRGQRATAAKKGGKAVPI